MLLYSSVAGVYLPALPVSAVTKLTLAFWSVEAGRVETQCVLVLILHLACRRLNFFFFLPVEPWGCRFIPLCLSLLHPQELGGEVMECYSQGPWVRWLFRKAGAFGNSAAKLCCSCWACCPSSTRTERKAIPRLPFLAAAPFCGRPTFCY